MAQDEGKEQTFQTLWNVRHALFTGLGRSCCWFAGSKSLSLLLGPFLAVIMGGLGVCFTAPLLKIRYFAPLGLSRSLSTAGH